MTFRKQTILENALHLFANEGYDAVSTRKIADQSEVSEALIFRHFKSKTGLLEQLIQKASALFEQYTATDKTGSQCIQYIMELPFHLSPTELELWKFTYRMKWSGIQGASEVTHLLKQPLRVAFKEIGFTNPAIEADLVMCYVHGFATSIIAEEQAQAELILSALQAKYAA